MEQPGRQKIVPVIQPPGAVTVSGKRQMAVRDGDLFAPGGKSGSSAMPKGGQSLMFLPYTISVKPWKARYLSSLHGVSITTGINFVST